MPDHPTLAQQIQAVAWAARHVDARKGKVLTRAMRESERDVIEAALIAAAETLKTLDFAREALG